MTDEELGKKIEMAAMLLRQVQGSSPHWDVLLANGERWSARVELGKVVREIVVEGVRAVLDTPLDPRSARASDA